MQDRQLFKSNARWSLVSAALLFAVLFGWMLYYAGTATEKTAAYPHLIGLPIFQVRSIDGGFEIGPEYGIIVVPLLFGAIVFAASMLFHGLTKRATRRLPE